VLDQSSAETVERELELDALDGFDELATELERKVPAIDSKPENSGGN
jgi:hypothetical protein